MSFYDPLTNPPMPDWDALRNEEKAAVMKAWEMHSCRHADHGEVFGFYLAVREALQARERRYLEATMAYTPEIS